MFYFVCERSRRNSVKETISKTFSDLLYRSVFLKAEIKSENVYYANKQIKVSTPEKFFYLDGVSGFKNGGGAGNSRTNTRRTKLKKRIR